MTDAPADPKRYLVRTFGCQMNEHDSERISGLFDADGMEATDDLEQADVVVLNTCCIRENADHELFPSAMPARRDEGYTAWVTIQIGCDNSCAFCIVPAVRGEEISRPFAEIVDEIEALAAAGVTEVTLLG